MSKQVRASAEVQAAIDAILSEAEALDTKAADGDITPEEADKLSGLVDQLKSLNTEKVAAEASEEVARFKLARKAQRTVEAPRIITSRTVNHSEDKESRRKAWQAWALGGTRGYSVSRSDRVLAEDLGLDPSANTISLTRALSKATSNAPVPEDFTNEYSDKLKYFFNVGEIVGSLNTTDGRDLPFATVDDTSNSAAIVGEASTIGSTKDPSFGEVVFKAWKYSSDIVKVSAELLQDSSIDIPSYLAQAFAKRHGRAYEAAVVSANAGSAAPEGLFNGQTAAVNLASGNAITLAKLIDLEVSVDPEVRSMPGCGWLMHDATWGKIRQLADDENFPVFTTDLQNGVSKNLLGYPVFISNQMTSIASPGDNQPLIMFGNFKESYTWRTVANKRLVRLDELYAGTDQVGFLLLERVDGRYIQSSYLKMLSSYDS